MTLEIRHLRTFLVVLEEGSITRAARRLRLAQPAVSKTIGQLEHTIGIALLVRSPHGVTTTDAGTRFKIKAAAALTAFDDAVNNPTRGARALRVGHAWSAIGTYTTEILRSWRAEHPGTELELQRLDDPVAALSDSRVDACLVRGEQPSANYTSELLYSEPRVAAVPVGHPLADSTAQPLSAFAGDLLVINTSSGTTNLEMWPPASRPTVGAEVSTVDDWLTNIAAGRGIGITPKSSSRMQPHPEVAFIALTDAQHVHVYLVRPPGAHHPALDSFIELAHTIIGK